MRLSARIEQAGVTIPSEPSAKSSPFIHTLDLLLRKVRFSVFNARLKAYSVFCLGVAVIGWGIYIGVVSGKVTGGAASQFPTEEHSFNS